MRKKKFKIEWERWINWLLVLGLLLLFTYTTISIIKSPLTPPSCKRKENIFFNRDLYSLCFDKKTKQPAWIFQIIEPGYFVTSLSNDFKDYYQDISIPKHQQASEEDYENSKWVVGNYLFPFPKDMKQWTDENPNDQYLFSVTSPQNKELNQGYWEKLRDRVKEISLNKKEDLNTSVGVFSGPLFLVNNREELRFLGKNKILIPTHFFVIIIPDLSGEDMKAYVIPNEKIQEKTPLKNFEVPLKKLKTISGIKGVENVNNLMPIGGPIPVP